MSPAPPHPLRAVGLVLLLGLSLLAGQLVTPGRAQALGSCTTTVNSAAYTVILCLTSPNGALTGGVPLAATVDVQPAAGVVAPGVEKVVFSFAGQYLLSDHDPAYGMT